jgi:hypothetical protein
MGSLGLAGSTGAVDGWYWLGAGLKEGLVQQRCYVGVDTGMSLPPILVNCSGLGSLPL